MHPGREAPVRSWIFCCVVAALAPLVAPWLREQAGGHVAAERAAEEAADAVLWADALRLAPYGGDGGRVWREEPLGERERRFAAGFPGEIARFHDGTSELVLRRVTRPTRRLHPAAECFAGLGYAITPLPPERIDGVLWGRFLAVSGGERLLVRERLAAASGDGAWSDVSAWYWAAAWGRTEGPWWALTHAERAEN